MEFSLRFGIIRRANGRKGSALTLQENDVSMNFRRPIISCKNTNQRQNFQDKEKKKK